MRRLAARLARTNGDDKGARSGRSEPAACAARYHNGRIALARISDQREGIAVEPLQFGHMLEIHPVDAGDQRRRHEHHREHREDLHDIILLEADQPERGVEQEGQIVAEEIAVVVERIGVGDQAFDVAAVGGVARPSRRSRRGRSAGGSC